MRTYGACLLSERPCRGLAEHMHASSWPQDYTVMDLLQQHDGGAPTPDPRLTAGQSHLCGAFLILPHAHKAQLYCGHDPGGSSVQGMTLCVACRLAYTLCARRPSICTASRWSLFRPAAARPAVQHMPQDPLDQATRRWHEQPARVGRGPQRDEHAQMHACNDGRLQCHQSRRLTSSSAASAQHRGPCQA